MSEGRVYIRHIRQENLCASGTRRWFQNHKFDWSDFLANGIAIETLAATGDAFAARVIENARKEIADGQK